MSKANDRLRALKIFNGHKAVEKSGVEPGVYLSYVPNGQWNSSRWCVVRPGFNTDPDAHFMDDGNKVFPLHQHEHSRVDALRAAQEWCEKRYGFEPGDWGTIPGLSGYSFPGVIVRAVKEYVKQAEAEIKRTESDTPS